MKEDKLNIALTFSGGGYRAATFHLGVLSYLHSVKIGGDSTLLEHVVALSTISGGTITGLRYMIGLSRNESVEDIYNDLYSFFTEVDLATIAMQNLSTYKDGMSASLIRTMADIYDDRLFKNARFGKLMDDVKEKHVAQFSANATDFTNGLSFRFQATIGKKDKESGYGVIGNNNIRIPRTIARHIRLADVLACSSCFPSGFEPMVFPQDFDLGQSEEVKAFVGQTIPFGIMDGGIVDNQGIEPILLAEQRMKSYYPDRKDKCIDLLIISDVSSPYMDAYKPVGSYTPNFVSNLSLKKVLSGLWIISGVTTALTALVLFKAPATFIAGFVSVIWLLTTIVLLLFLSLKKKLVKFVGGTIAKHSIRSILNLKFGDLATLVGNRVNSVLLLVMSVFMKHLRRMNYRSTYTDPAWENRCVTNGIYELRPGEAWVSNIKNGSLPEYLKPSELIQRNSEKAASMGTTLWFTEEEKADGMHDAVIACGQYTMCFNLLQYIETIKKRSRNLNKQHAILLTCEQQLKADWERFQKDPFWKL